MGPVIVPPPFDELEDRILPWSQVKVICGLSRTTVWRMQKSGDFPACVQVSLNRVGWWQSELLAWKRARAPRRLPEPRSLAAPSPEAVPEMTGPPGPDHEPRTSPAPPASDPADAVVAPRRKRKPSIAENQTAFDFGG